MDSTLSKIYRTEISEGVSIPGIIKNGNYFFVDLEVYEDGRVECWNFQDFEHFKNDVFSGWVSVDIPDDQEISISSLGDWEINETSWLYTKESFIEYVWSIVKKLNPDLNNIYTYSQKIINGIRVGESGLGKIYKEKVKYSDDPFPERIIGKGINLFIKGNRKEYYLARFDIYSQESIVVSRVENSFEISLTQLEEMISNEQVLTQLPIGSKVYILGLGYFKIKEEKYSTKISEKLLEIKDTIRVLNREPTTLQLCKEIYKQYVEHPTEELKTQLKKAYEGIPEHRRMYVGDMDVKDTAVRMIIYGEQEIEKWSHYQVAKKMGEILPTINIPKPKKE